MSDLFPRSDIDSDTPIGAAATPGTDIGFTRHQETRRRRARSRLLVACGVISVGAIVVSGLSAQSASQSAAAEEKARLSATAVLAMATGPHPEQAGSLAEIVPAHAAASARTTLVGANGVIMAAQGKTDATALSSTVAALGDYTLLAPERVFDLVEQVHAEAEVVKVSTAEVDRTAAEQAAAAAAAAQAAAEAQAAADAAAAQAAAQAQAQAQAVANAKAAAPKPAAPAPATPARPAAPTNPSGAQAIARDMMASKYGWGADQFGCLVSLWNKESGWNVNAYNASSGATGIPQALPGSKMASAGADWATNPATQISWGLSYIAERYGSACGAWNKSVASGWY
ncbi:MAG: lytic transglycosylase domain-containing protein [Cryobacterium sp.]|nr:lytic transglycosylase domain-containing protein [Cryobacterium sp.]